MPSELREFVYLDEMSVNSLLASQYVAVPEEVREATENIEGEDSGFHAGLSVDIPGVGGGEIGGETSSSEEMRSSREIQRKINGQYRFSILHDVLNNSDMLQDLSEYPEDEELNFNSGDTIKIQGQIDPDPFYKLFSAFSLLIRMFEVERAQQLGDDDDDLGSHRDEIMIGETESVFDVFQEVLHGERIGLRVKTDNFNYPVVMSIELESLWTDPKREFFSTKSYTVVGRVDHVVPRRTWDYIDLLQIMGEVFTEDSVSQFRDVLMEISEDLDSGGEAGQEQPFDFDVEIERSDYAVDGPAVVINPVAIYW